jgi:hypothetical protein
VESFGNYVCCKNLYLVQPGDAAYTISRHMLPEYCKNSLIESRRRMQVYQDG